MFFHRTKKIRAHTSIINKTEKIYVPWITEDGEVLWDEKMEWENERR